MNTGKRFFVVGRYEAHPDLMSRRLVIVGDESVEVSDGYHTMTELYEHRITLFIALCHQIYRLSEFTEYFKEHRNKVCIWRSKLHSDGTSFDGWFVLGIGKEKGEQMTYHLPHVKWDEVSFAETLDNAPEFDGHTPSDVLERLKTL